MPDTSTGVRSDPSLHWEFPFHSLALQPETYELTHVGVATTHAAARPQHGLVECPLRSAPLDSVLGYALLQMPSDGYTINGSTRCGPRPCMLDATASVQRPLGESLPGRLRPLPRGSGTVSASVPNSRRIGPGASPAACRGSIRSIRRNAKRSSPAGTSWVGRFPQHHFGIERVSDAGRHPQHDHGEVADVFPDRELRSCDATRRSARARSSIAPAPPQFGREVVAMGNHPSIEDFLSRMVESGLMSGCVRREFAKRWVLSWSSVPTFVVTPPVVSCRTTPAVHARQIRSSVRI